MLMCEPQQNRSRTSAWVFSCQFGAYFRNTFSKEHLWRAASEFHMWNSYISITPINRFTLSR